ncbi:MAG: hypothetical protein IJX99_09215 [Clostridia bacterium]|nr:hypothetical protein [Clostridia bacterium]
MIGKIVLISLIIPIGFLIARIAQIDQGYIDPLTNRSRSDYVLMIIQCILGIFALTLPNMLFKKKIQIPTNMYMLYMIFLYCAICLGELRSFYYKIPNWDTILHTFSGGMMGALGFSFVSLLNKTENFHLKLTPSFVALFSFMLSTTLGVLWEVYEFAFDGLLGLNMQKFMLESGEMLVGRAAVVDTMEDLIVDMFGAFVMSVIGYISLKYKKGWVEKLIIKVKKHGAK